MELLDIIKHTSASIRAKNDVESNRLQELDYIASIELTCQRFNLDLKQDLFSNADYLSYFTAIDDKTRLMVEKIGQSYLKIDITNQPYKSRMANAAFLHHRLMFSIYFKLIAALAPNEHPQLGNLISRALNNATEVIKWRYLNYQGAPGNIWTQISSLFELAEQYNLTTQAIAPYPELHAATYIPNTIASSYVTVNMLGSLESLSFNPQQIDFVTKALSLWTESIRIENKYDENRHLFSADTNKSMPAKRIRNITPTPSNRFWCMDEVNIGIQNLIARIEENRMPEQAAMQPLANHLYALKTLQTVRTEWSLSEYKRQRRAHPRVKTDKVASNVFGFEDTYYQIKHYEDALVEVQQQSFSESKASKPVSEEQSSDYHESMTAFINMKHGFCNIVDESVNGLCMHVEKKPNELSAGMMIGIAIEGNRFGTKIGIIRSIKTTENNTLRVGVEIISRNAFSVSAQQTMNDNTQEEGNESIDALIDQHRFEGQSDAFNCLFLPKEFSYTKAQTLILPKHRYVANGQYEMKLSKEIKLIQTKAMLAQHDNWVRVYFEEMQEN